MRLLIHDYAGHPFQVQLSRELARRGYRVTHAFAGGLLTPRGALIRRDSDPADFDVREVPMSPRYRAEKYNFVRRRNYEVEYGRELARIVHIVRPDVIISANTPTEPQYALIDAAGQVPVVTWLQDFYSVAISKLLRNKLPFLGAPVSALYRYLDRRCLSRSAAVVSITEDFLPLLAQFGVPSSKVTVIPNWAPLHELPLRPRNNTWSQMHGLDDKFTFLYSGTLAMKHNPGLLHRLAAEFSGDPSVRIVIITEGPGADFLSAKKASEQLNNMTLLPFQPFDAMPDVLATADVLLSVLEADAGVFSVPSKVLTYLCARRALLGAMPPENLASRTIVQQRAGLVVGPEDGSGFVSAAKRLQADAALRLACGDAGRRYAESAFDIDRIADRFEVIINQARK